MHGHPSDFCTEVPIHFLDVFRDAWVDHVAVIPCIKDQATISGERYILVFKAILVAGKLCFLVHWE